MTKLDEAAEKAGPEAVAELADILKIYEGKCALCKYFRGAFERNSRPAHEWIDDEGWCVRYPPVFIGGENSFEDETDTTRYSQPGVYGHEECGEYVTSPDIISSASTPSK